MRNPFTKMIARRVAAEVDAMRAEFEERLRSMVEHVLTTVDFPELSEFADSLELLRDEYDAIDFEALESAADTVGDFEDTLGDFETRLENVEAACFGDFETRLENVESEGAADREKIEELDDRVTGWADSVSETVDRVEEIAYHVNGIEDRLTEVEELADAIEVTAFEKTLEITGRLDEVEQRKLTNPNSAFPAVNVAATLAEVEERVSQIVDVLLTPCVHPVAADVFRTVDPFEGVQS